MGHRFLQYGESTPRTYKLVNCSTNFESHSQGTRTHACSYRTADKIETKLYAWRGWRSRRVVIIGWIFSATLQDGSLSTLQIAGIIEIALLNYTNVIALITHESFNSRWILS